ncbi:MAG: FAD binding domain-containing protein [Actinomycetia bacterium]|nr:FAD binding domain-containing protein [Actinomycetes bacterium]
MHDVQDRTWSVDRFERPATIDEALALLDRYGSDARIVAGATDLLLELQRHIRTVDMLIDLSAIDDLDGVDMSAGTVTLGPLTTHRQVVESDIVRQFGLPLAQASLEVGSAQLRNRATVVGNLVTASPANDTISALLALDAQVELASIDGDRTVSLSDFYTGVRQTVMASNELVTAVRFPAMSSGTSGMFAKVGLRSAQAISVVHAAVVIERLGGVISNARIALGSVAPTVVLADAARSLEGSALTAETIERCASLASGEVTPITDGRATAAYRSHLVRVVLSRMLHTLAAGDESSQWPTRVITLADGGTHSSIPMAAGPNDPIRVLINGTGVTAPGATHESLLDWIRSNARSRSGELLTGTKEGCAEGECGACTVHMDGQSVLACLVLAGSADGHEITTIEGLDSPDDVRLQDSFIACGAVQCGFCTPGFVMAASSLRTEMGELTADEIRDGLSGNICRCTGYESIVEALVSTPTGGTS